MPHCALQAKSCKWPDNCGVAAAWAIYKEAHFPLALCIFLAQTIWSGFKAIDTLTKRVTD